MTLTGPGHGVSLLPDKHAQSQTPSGPVRGVASHDGALLERIIAGDEVAFAELVKLYHAQVYRLAWRVLGGPGDADDVAQEAFVKLWRSPRQIRDGHAVRAWLMRVASNLAIDRLRRKQVKPTGELPDIADEAAGADKVLRRDAVAARMDAAIAGLPARQRTALILSYFEGFSNPETAEALEVSVEAVESLLARARRTLKAALAGSWREMLDELEQL